MRRFACTEFAVTMVVFFLLGLACTMSAAASVRVEPSRLLLNLEVGERTTGAINVSNNSDRTVDLMANYYDWDLTEQYALRTYEAGTLKETLDGLIRFNPRRFTLDPGETQLVRFTVSLPEGDEDPFERRGIIFFEQEETFEEEEGMGATVRSLIGTTVYATPTNHSIRFRLLQAMVHVTDKGDYLGAVLTKNEGGAHIRNWLDYKIVDSGGKVVEEGSVEEQVILPGQERGVFFPLEGGYRPGAYELLMNFRISGVRETATHSIFFDVEAQ